MLFKAISLGVFFATIAATTAQADVDERTLLTQLRTSTVIEVESRIPLTRGAFRQIFKDGRRQAGEYHYSESVKQEIEKLPRWEEACELILHVSHRPQKIKPDTKLVVSDAKVVPGYNGGVILEFDNSDQVRAIRCTGKSPDRDSGLTVGDLKRAFGAKLKVL